jgi:translation initiation factor IF-2
MPIRVYELSKKLNKTNKELLALLQELGFSITTHMAIVPPEAVQAIEKKLQPSVSSKTGQDTKTKTAPAVSPKAPPIEPIKQEIKSKPIAAQPVIKAETIRPMQTKQSEVTTKKNIQEINEPKKNTIVIAPMTVSDFALIAQKPVSEVILTLLRQGVAATKNQLITEKSVAQLAHVYNIEVVEGKAPAAMAAKKDLLKPQAGNYMPRLPIVVVIGHVDHGKTTLLDFIRKTRIAAREKGGITQHLGAYEVKTGQGNLVFLDTPGHEAFSLMRAKGIKVADIAILVVAADDGVMPQTLEAMKRAQSAEIPIIVAINKIDKASPAQIEKVKKELSQHGLTPEDWGGQTVAIGVSAKLGTGVNELLEVLALQAQLMELEANMSIPAHGYILESKLEKGRGFVATVILHHGTLKVGDYFRAGKVTGRVSSLMDSDGKRIMSIGPSSPALVAGFSELPDTGDVFDVITHEQLKKNIIPEQNKIVPTQKSSDKDALNIIVKTDNMSSKEALIIAIQKIAHKLKKQINVLTASIGNIVESDILLAADTHATIYGLHTKTESNAVTLAQKHDVKIKHFDIIYKFLEDIESVIEMNKPVKMVSKKIGEAIVLKVFDIKDLGVIAGAQVKTGRFSRDGKVIIYRGKQKVGEGNIKSLQRDRKSVKEVHAGFECAFMIDGFSTWEVDDRVECYIETPEETK